MVKNRVSADVRSLADRYFCEQCDRLGLPRPHPIKPIKAPKLPSDKPRKAHEEDRRSDLDQLAETGVWIRPRSYADAFGELPPDRYGDPTQQRGFVTVDPELVAKDREEGLRIELDHAKWLAAPKMDLEAIWKALGEDR